MLALALLASAWLAACSKGTNEGAEAHPATREDAAATAVVLPVATTARDHAGDAARGKELVLKYQCNRCHEGTGHEAAPTNEHCVRCHSDIMEGRVRAAAPTLARWKARASELANAPSLTGASQHLSRDWIEGYLLAPTDLRPHLTPSMPRLAISAADARDIARFLVPDGDDTSASRRDVSSELASADLGRGRSLLETKGCGACHTFEGVVPIPSSAPPAMSAAAFARSRALAPDLGATRTRMTAAQIVRWLEDPALVKADSAMPKIALQPSEIRDLAAYILLAEVGQKPSAPRAELLPRLSRKVTYREVDERVFHRTCWHCHSEPDYAIGEGGPGNTGGFGFEPRGLNLSSYDAIAAGILNGAGERESIFATDAQGVSRLVRALLARHHEEAGVAENVRGMPLGYPPVSLEDIQLVDTWVSQGRPR